MTEHSPVVTIAIPTYNRADGFLSAALESALAQTENNIEIVISDNASTDHTEDLIRGYSDPRIRYCRQETNLGPNNNFNFCVENARGKYFLLLSDDDLIDPDFVESCLRSVSADNAVGIIRTGTRVIDETGAVQYENTNDVTGLSTAEFFMEWFCGHTALYLCSTLLHTEHLRGLGGFKSPHNLFQDVVAEARLASRYGRADVREIKASFRRHSGNFGNVSRLRDWCEDSRYVLDLLCALSPKAGRQFRRRGEIFFCEQNYDRASRIPQSWRRWWAYGLVWRWFNFARSPFRYFRIRKKNAS